MKFAYFIFGILFSFLIIISCNDDEIEVISDEQFGYNYFPTEVGKFRAYRLELVTYSALGVALADTTFLREEFESIDIDTEGDTIYTARILEKNDISAPWVQTGFATEQRNNTRAIRSRDNFRFVRLTFPVIEGNQWDGLIFIDNTVEIPFQGENVAVYQGWGDHQYIGGSSSMTIGDLNFADVITVLESDQEGITDLRESTSMYARNIGLIKRTQRIFSLSCNGVDDPCYSDTLGSWESQTEGGFSLIQEIIGHN